MQLGIWVSLLYYRHLGLKQRQTVRVFLALNRGRGRGLIELLIAGMLCRGHSGLFSFFDDSIHTLMDGKE